MACPVVGFRGDRGQEGGETRVGGRGVSLALGENVLCEGLDRFIIGLH